jgi:5,10-methylene-tetrahydrofolate dehydrogenase/methenyl tetrahydrofolate cyclohydrolase
LYAKIVFFNNIALVIGPTPPGTGVGPMTRAMLLKNTILAYKHTIYKD